MCAVTGRASAAIVVTIAVDLFLQERKPHSGTSSSVAVAAGGTSGRAVIYSDSFLLKSPRS